MIRLLIQLTAAFRQLQEIAQFLNSDFESWQITTSSITQYLLSYR